MIAGRRPRISKPSAGARLDRSHPLARGLVALVPIAVTAGPLEDAAGGPPLAVSPQTQWSAEAMGAAMAATNPGSGASATIPPGSPARVLPPAFTIGLGLTWGGTNPTAAAPICGTSVDDTAGGGPAYAIGITADATHAYLYAVAAGTYLEPFFTLAAFVHYTAYFAAWAGGAGLFVYGPGGPAWNNAQSITLPAAAYAPTAQWFVGSQAGSTPSSVYCLFSWASLHARNLAQGDLTALAADPWQIFPRHRYRAGPVFRRTLSARAGSRGGR